MALRSRLSLAFVFVVLVPVLVGFARRADRRPAHLARSDRRPAAYRERQRHRRARSSLHRSEPGRPTLGSRGRGARPGCRGQADGRRRHCRLRGGRGSEQRRSWHQPGQLPSGTTPTPLPAVLNSCGDRTNAGLAISSRAALDIAAAPSLKSVAVAWAVGATTASNLRAGLVSQPAVTLLVDGATGVEHLEHRRRPASRRPPPAPPRR